MRQYRFCFCSFMFYAFMPFVFIFIFIFIFLFLFIIMYLSCCVYTVAVGVVGTVVNRNSLSDRPFVGVGNFVCRVWAKRTLFCPCAVHKVIHARKWLRTLGKLGFSIVSIMLSFKVFAFPKCNHQIFERK